MQAVGQWLLQVIAGALRTLAAWPLLLSRMAIALPARFFVIMVFP